MHNMQIQAYNAKNMQKYAEGQTNIQHFQYAKYAKICSLCKQRHQYHSGKYASTGNFADATVLIVAGPGRPRLGTEPARIIYHDSIGHWHGDHDGHRQQYCQ